MAIHRSFSDGDPINLLNSWHPGTLPKQPWCYGVCRDNQPLIVFNMHCSSNLSQVFEVAPYLYMMEFCKAGGNTLEFHKLECCLISISVLTTEMFPSMSTCPSLDTLLLGQWEERMQTGLFRYDVTTCDTKVIPGDYGFIAQLNEGRHLKKCPTEFRVDKVQQDFDPSKFNFSKVGQEEVLFHFEESEEDKVHYLEKASVLDSPNVVAINVSPTEYGHVLVVPRVLECLPQCIDHDSLLLALHLAAEIDHPGAFATITHLHFQLEQWHVADEYSGLLREISFRSICNNPMCPPDTAMTEWQHSVFTANNRVLVFETVQQAHDVPFGSYFEVHSRWILETTSESSCTIDIKVGAHFKKWCWMQSKIKTGAVTEYKKDIELMLKVARAYLESSKQVGSIDANNEEMQKSKNPD